MKVYIATAFGNFEKAEMAERLLLETGHTSTASWISVAKKLNGDDKGNVGSDVRRREAESCLLDIKNSDALLLLVPSKGGCGMWVELGYMIGMRGVRANVLAVGPAQDRTLFCELPRVKLFSSLKDAINSL